jgi:ABC-type nitrate/sulfonate/bicarbonate transport system substrate-binding protein
MKIGFIPLVDCAPLVIAKEKGFFAREGLDVKLGKVQNWMQLLDRLQRGECDGAHMLATLPVLAAAGAAGIEEPICTAWVISSSANGITLSNRLCRAGVWDGHSLSDWLGQNPDQSIRFGIVMERSTQELTLREWMQQGGVEVGDRVQLMVCPPQEMARRMREGILDGFCSGEPWNQRATSSKLGGIVALGDQIMGDMPEKVLAVRRKWHEDHKAEHGAVLRSVAAASAWLEDPANLDEATGIVADKYYVNTQAQLLRFDLSRKIQAGWNKVLESPGFLKFTGINMPKANRFVPLLERLVWWGHLPSSALECDLDKICLEEFHRELFPSP